MLPQAGPLQCVNGSISRDDTAVDHAALLTQEMLWHVCTPFISQMLEALLKYIRQVQAEQQQQAHVHLQQGSSVPSKELPLFQPPGASELVSVPSEVIYNQDVEHRQDSWCSTVVDSGSNTPTFKSRARLENQSEFEDVALPDKLLLWQDHNCPKHVMLFEEQIQWANASRDSDQPDDLSRRRSSTSEDSDDVLRFQSFPRFEGRMEPKKEPVAIKEQKATPSKQKPFGSSKSESSPLRSPSKRGPVNSQAFRFPLPKTEKAGGSKMNRETPTSPRPNPREMKILSDILVASGDREKSRQRLEEELLSF